MSEPNFAQGQRVAQLMGIPPSSVEILHPKFDLKTSKLPNPNSDTGHEIVEMAMISTILVGMT